MFSSNSILFVITFNKTKATYRLLVQGGARKECANWTANKPIQCLCNLFLWVTLAQFPKHYIFGNTSLNVEKCLTEESSSLLSRKMYDISIESKIIVHLVYLSVHSIYLE